MLKLALNALEGQCIAKSNPFRLYMLKFYCYIMTLICAVPKYKWCILNRTATIWIARSSGYSSRSLAKSKRKIA